MIYKSVTKLVDSLKSVTVVRLSVESALEIHLLHIAAAVGNLAGEIPAGSFDAHVHVTDSTLGVAAALCELCGESVDTCLILIAEVTDGGIYPVETVGDSVVEGVCAVSDSVSLLIELADESLLIHSSAYVSLSSAGSTATVTVAAPTAKAVSAPAEEKEDDDPPRAVATEHTVAVVVGCTRTDVSGSHFVKRHNLNSFQKNVIFFEKAKSCAPNSA
jgi:hypothetical protein